MYIIFCLQWDYDVHIVGVVVGGWWLERPPKAPQRLNAALLKVHAEGHERSHGYQALFL